MRCRCCDKILPPHRIMSGNKDIQGREMEEDLCSSCLSTVYSSLDDEVNIYEDAVIDIDVDTLEVLDIESLPSLED